MPDIREAPGAAERSRRLVDAITEYAIYMLDRDGVVLSWNAGAELIKGYAAGEVLGTHFAKFYTAEDRHAGEPERALATAAREGKYAKEGCWRIRKDGSRFWASVVLNPIRDEGGGIVGFAKVSRDITERLKDEEARERQRTVLARSQAMAGIGQPAAPDPASEAAAAVPEGKLRAAAGTVLLVEDDPDVMAAAVDTLRSLGYEVLTADDGVSALEVLRRPQPIDVLFTDIVMPRGMNGVELARRACAMRPTLRVLLASGYPMAALSNEHGLTGQFAFLSKPYRWAELADKLRTAGQPTL